LSVAVYVCRCVYVLITMAYNERFEFIDDYRAQTAAR